VQVIEKGQVLVLPQLAESWRNALSDRYLVYRINQETENPSLKYIDLLDQKTAP
jgi:hypothetical protein